MKLNQVSANHSELTGETRSRNFYRVCFSYGRCAVLRIGCVYYVNAAVWQYSTSTSRHINSTFPNLRGMDIDNPPSCVVVIADDSRMDAVFADVVGGVNHENPED